MTANDTVFRGQEYHDDGCEVAPRCLECPLEKCRHEVRGGARAIRHPLRNNEIIRLRAEGASTKMLMELFGLTRRSIYRILAGEKR